MLEINKFYCGDCLELMPQIAKRSIGLITSDIPYGVTNNEIDRVIPLDELWKHYKRIRTPRAAIVLTSQFPYTLELILSNRSEFKYDLIWDKGLTTGFLNANKMPLRRHEHILVFYNKLPPYNPQKVFGKMAHTRGKGPRKNSNYNEFKNTLDNAERYGHLKFPDSILRIQKPHPSKMLHPTEKPVELFEWIIRTFSNPGDVVLDNCAGTGAAPVAAMRTGRPYIAIDKNPEFVEIGRRRLKQSNLNGFDK